MWTESFKKNPCLAKSMKMRSQHKVFLLLLLGVQRCAQIDSGDVIVLRVNAEVDYVRALQPIVNVTQMSVEIVGLGNVIIFFLSLTSFYLALLIYFLYCTSGC